MKNTQEREINLGKAGEQKEIIGNKPYVVSADIRLLLQRWANEKNFVLPPKKFFDSLRGEFNSYMRGIFPGYELVPEEELVNGIENLVAGTGLVPVTLDGVYYLSKPSIDINRLVDKQKQDIGLGRRPGSDPLLKQFRQLKQFGLKEVALVDDVVFSGDLILRTKKVLESMGIKVPVVCAGVAIGEGVQKLNQLGIEAQYVRFYQNVIDEVCERDFYPGVPQSGRTIKADYNLGAPYVLPYGKPNQWASIPEERQVDFSEFCLKQSKRLFRGIEKYSNKRIWLRDIDRKMGRATIQPIPFMMVINQAIGYGDETLYGRP